MTINPSLLRDRLRGIVAPRGGEPPPRPERASRGTTLDHERLTQALGGEWRAEEGGRSFVVTRRVASDARHGRSTVGGFASALRAAGEAASLLAAGHVRAPFIFFDLETTGLSGGAGTHAFLVGCGWFDHEGAFVTEQHLLTDFGSEKEMLALVARDLSRAGILVSFNGKSFDAPVIETRYLFHRLASPCSELPHLDVLHPARRFWGGHPELGCSLGVLEAEVLGATREDDVSGFEIPGRYFEFIRSGDAARLAEVCEHNRLDLLSLAGVTARLLTLVAEGAAAAASAREALGLGRVYERAGAGSRAVAAYERALTLLSNDRPGARGGRRTAADSRATPDGIRVEALRSLALLARRGRQFDEAAHRWRQLLDTPGCPAHVTREATEALAIHHEHRVRDLEAAKMFALKSLESGTEAAWGDAVRHRLARIERKMVSGTLPLFPSLPLLPSYGSPTSEPRTSS